jgi:hypothetical protein
LEYPIYARTEPRNATCLAIIYKEPDRELMPDGSGNKSLFEKFAETVTGSDQASAMATARRISLQKQHGTWAVTNFSAGNKLQEFVFAPQARRFVI